MKTLAISIILALGVSAPAFAQSPPADQPAQAAPAPSTEATPDTALIDEASILEAATPEARVKLLLKCSGPPPRPVASKVTPSSEPVTVAEKPAASGSTGE